MYCPVCRTAKLVQQRLPNVGVTVDVCPGCKGAWFEKGELLQAVPMAVEKLVVPRKAEKTGRLCPQCQRLLVHFQYPRTLVEVDACRRCRGLWLEAGEKEEIEAVRNSLPSAGEGSGDTGGGEFLHRIFDEAMDMLWGW